MAWKSFTVGEFLDSDLIIKVKKKNYFFAKRIFVTTIDELKLLFQTCITKDAQTFKDIARNIFIHIMNEWTKGLSLLANEPYLSNIFIIVRSPLKSFSFSLCIINPSGQLS